MSFDLYYLNINMLEYLIKLPCEVLGHNMLGYLDLIDIIQLENAVASNISKQLLRAILLYCPAIVLSNEFQYDNKALNWFSKRFCRVKGGKLAVKLLCKLVFDHPNMYNFELCLELHTTLQYIEPLNNLNINQKIKSMVIREYQDPAVMDVLFSLLSNSSVRSLYIQSSNLSQWMEHIKNIGPCMRELLINYNNTVIKTITEYCPYLEKLNCSFESGVSDSSDILQSIASSCPHIRNLDIKLMYDNRVLADADLTAFAEKCPQLEELSLYCKQLTDQSVIALAQHCSRLKKLQFFECEVTVDSLIALSERGLPLEELIVIPWIPIPSAEIAAQCAHALSLIHTFSYNDRIIYYYHVIKYMTGLRELDLWESKNYMLVPYLLQLPQGYFAGLQILAIGSGSSITPYQLTELLTKCPLLNSIYIFKSTCISDAVLIELTRSCPYLQKVKLDSSEVTEEGVLALAMHCRQLRELYIPHITVTEEAVRQLVHHCRRLTKLSVYILLPLDQQEEEQGSAVSREFTSKQMRAMREQPIEGCK